MNNKGFMMAEVIVVAAIILAVMVGLYASYNKIFSLYNKRVDYYDVATLYELGNIRDGIDFSVDNPSIDGPIFSDASRKVYYINKAELNNLSNSFDTELKYKEYLKFLSTSIETDVDNILVMERCKIKDDGKVDINNCKYAYLEVFK